MPSGNPFPGMNPWLESLFGGDLHASLITYTRDALQPHLPPALFARMEEWVLVADEEEVYRRIRPDVHVLEEPRYAPDWGGQYSDGGGTAVLEDTQTQTITEPLVFKLPKAHMTQRSIHLYDRGTGGRLVTVIEFLSTDNKRRGGSGREAYLEKREEAVDAEVNVVEVDLLRGGEPTTLAGCDVPDDAPRTPYHVSVWRPHRYDMVEYYPIPLRESLPTIRIPLRRDDPDLPLDLQAVLEEAIRKGRHGELIDYTRRPEPPLDADDAAWAAHLAASGLADSR